jgi:hypothetical protein
MQDHAADAVLVVVNDAHCAVAAYVGYGTGAAQECGMDKFKVRLESEWMLSEVNKL